MFLLIISILLCIGLFIFLGLKKEGRYENLCFKINKKQTLSLLPLLLILFNFISIVPPNNVGILYSPFSGVKEETLSEGLKAKGLFDTVYKISTEVQTKQLTDVSGQTRDSQFIKMQIDVKYQVNEINAFEVFRQYKTLNNLDASLIHAAVQRSVEAITTQYNIMEVLGEKRNEMYKAIENDLSQRLADSGIVFKSINFIDTDAGEAIETAIKNEAIAKKAVETAEQEREKAKIEAQKRVVEAEANKQKAEIEAKTKVIEAQAEADANKLISQSITPELIQRMEMEARQKWGWITVQGGSAIVDSRKEQP